jgi:putative tryptophan/tyrosine transport system substrate-binding protein
MRRREFITLVGGVAAGWPAFVLGAAKGKLRIGMLLLGYPEPETFLRGFRKGLSDLGYEEGRSVEIVIRSAEGKQAALLSLAGELMQLGVDIIVAYPTTAGLAAKQTTAETPIVVYGGDLEATHLVAGLARPGGNITGISGATADLAAKNLELIAEMLPTVRHVAVLANADSPLREPLLDAVRLAANARKVEIKAMSVHSADQLDGGFAEFEAWGAEALLVHPAPPAKGDCGSRNQASPSCRFSEFGVLRFRGTCILLAGHRSAGAPMRDIRGQDRQGPQAVGSPGRTPDELPAEGQPQDGPSDWIEYCSNAARSRRRSAGMMPAAVRVRR